MEELKTIKTVLTIKELQENIKDGMNDFSIDFCADYCFSYPEYLDDAMREYADNQASVYTSDQEDFYFKHRDFCDQVAADFCLLESFDPRHDSIGDLIAKAGAWGEVEYNYNQLSEDAESIRLLFALQRLDELNFDSITAEEWERVQDYANEDEDDISGLDDIHRIYISSYPTEPGSAAILCGTVAALKREDIRDYIEAHNIGEIIEIEDATTGERFASIDEIEEA